jgi:hypothetical protein
MGSKLSGTQAVKLESLDDAMRQWDRVRKLVEQAAASPKSQSDLMRQCHRTSTDVGRLLSNSGFGALSSCAGELAAVIKRPGMFQTKLGAMREAVGKGYVAFDRARRDIKQS